MNTFSLFTISEQNRRILNLFFNSRLMFVKDLNFLASLIPETTTQANSLRNGCIITSITTAINFSLFFFRRYAASRISKNVSVISACVVSAGTAGYIARLLFNDYKNKQETLEVESHIEFLQQFYALVQKVIYNFVITSGSTLSVHPSAYHGHTSFMTLIKIHKSLGGVLTLMNRTMSDGFISLKELISETDSSFPRHLLLDNLIFDTNSESISDVHNANSLYQVFQSEYLCWLAVTYCPVQHKNYRHIRRVTKNIVNSIHSKITISFYELNYHYTVYLHERNSIDSGVENQNVAGNYHVGLPDVTHKPRDDVEERNSPDQKDVYERRQLTPHTLRDLRVALKPVKRMHAAIHLSQLSKLYYQELITIEQDIIDSESGSSSKVKILYNLNILSPVNFPVKIDIASSSSLESAVSYNI